MPHADDFFDLDDRKMTPEQKWQAHLKVARELKDFPDDHLVPPRKAAAFIQYLKCAKTLEHERRDGSTIPFCVPTPRRPRYRLGDLRAFLAAAGPCYNHMDAERSVTR